MGQRSRGIVCACVCVCASEKESESPIFNLCAEIKKGETSQILCRSGGFFLCFFGGVHRMYGARALHPLLSPLTSDLLKGGVGASRVIWGQHISCW